VSRTRRAGITAAFGYAQFALALTSGILLVPFVLSQVRTDLYGVWLAFGEVLAYSSMVDLGVVGVVPWLVAENDGRGDREAMRAVLAAAVLFSSVAAAVFLVLAAGALRVAPSLARLPPGLAASATGPLLMVAVLMALAMPLRTFSAALVGLQDATFAGVLGVSSLALGVVLTVALLLGGYGLYALAAAASVPSVAVGLASWVRLRTLAPDLLRGWRVPSRGTFRAVSTQGLGSWTSGLGWRMVAASDSVVIVALMGPAAAVVYALTAKMGTIGMQMGWQLPDAALVGLAQLKGEGRDERVRAVAVQLLRLLLVASGGVACAVLAFNPAFVQLWVGPQRFGGMALNATIAAVILSHSLAHGLFTISATLGTRVQAGWASLAQGGVNLGAALLLGRALGLPGVALAAVVSTAVVAYPAGVWMLRRTTGMGQGELWRSALGPWALRCGALLALGLAVGALGTRTGPWVPFLLAPALAVLYLWAMRPLYAGLPLPPRVRGWLAALRLVPAAAARSGTPPSLESVRVPWLDGMPHPEPAPSDEGGSAGSVDPA
jgi:O-antigen/teichoic acid export membrane protein